MAGGVGTRLWPFSRKQKPKQFQDLLGSGVSLIQKTVERFEGICKPEHVFVVTNQEYGGLVESQLPMVPKGNILLEPTMKNTAPCIAYAVYKIASQDPTANIVVAPADHNIQYEEGFKQTVQVALQMTQEHDVLVTLGMKAHRPDTGYGYIQIDEEDALGKALKVKTFTEKPDLDTAIRFLEAGEFVWNSGMFFWNAKAILASFEENLPDIADIFSELTPYYYTDEEQVKVNEAYFQSPNISIDYGIMEKAKNVYVIRCDIGWSDLGTWKSLHEAAPKDENDNTISDNVISFDSRDTIVKIPKGQLAVINGVENLIIAEYGGVLVVCHKDKEQEIKDMVNHVKSSRDKKFT